MKEGDTCGPGGNRFTRNTVSVSSDDELTLEFKKVDGAWEASEVRVIMPDLEGGGIKKFQYGKYRFHLKSLAVIDSKESFLEWRKDHPCDSPSPDDTSGCSRTHVPHLFVILSMFGIASLLFSLI